MKLEKIILWLFFCIGGSTVLHAQDPENPAVLAYIAQYREMAISEMERTGVPAAIKLAQGIHETDAGRSDLVLRSNNHFGIKCKTSWTGEKVYHDDDMRGECFRKYPDAANSYRDHSDYLRSQPRYASLFTLDPMDYKGWAHGLKKAGYATNPKYTLILIKYIETYRLNEYTAFALGRMQQMPGLPEKTTTPMREPAVEVAAKPVKTEMESVVAPSPAYPSGEFLINGTRVVYASPGTSLLALAQQYHFNYGWILDFNDLQADRDILERGQLVFLQRKRKKGEEPFHIVKKGECLYDISQARGIRMESLMELNRLEKNMEPAEGVRLNLQEKVAERPALALTGVVAGSQANIAAPPTENASVQPRQTGQSQTNDVASEMQEIRHTVQPKETLFSLARKYEVSVDQIKAWNKLDTSDLKPGQELVILKKL